MIRSARGWRHCLLAVALFFGTAPMVMAADLAEVARDPQWLALLHEHGGDLIGDPAFYLAPDGRSDPRAELDATLAAFQSSLPAEPDRDPRCLWPARYQWLDDQLGLSGRRPPPTCPELAAWLAAIQPHTATLVFPTAYLNNPSSMFGHTLLRIDPTGQQEPTPLTSYAVNYGAQTGADGGVAFAFKGLAGFYPGYFSLQPYYTLVRQYSDFENRDIWEYRLDLTPAEVERLVLHVWELRDRWTEYYFLEQNCSYMLLALLEVARPQARLTQRFRVYAIPIDTVRAAIRETGLIGKAVFRPSARTRIEALLATATPAVRRLGRDLAAGRTRPGDPALTALPHPEQARAIEIAQDLLSYRLDTGDLAQAEAAPRGLSLLRARAALADVAAPAEPPTPVTSPEHGHASGRVNFGGGVTGTRPFASLALRPAYHALDDAAAGFVPGAAIQFLDGELRAWGPSEVALERLDLLTIRSLSPVDALFDPISWSVDAKVSRWRRDADDRGDLVGELAAAGGRSWRIGDLLLGPALQAGLLADGSWPDGRVFALGPVAHAIWTPTEHVTLDVEAQAGLVARIDGVDGRYGLVARQTWQLTPDFAVRSSQGWRDDGARGWSEFQAGIAWYF